MNKTKLLFVSTVDMSRANGQGRYAYGVLKSLLDACNSEFSIQVCAPSTDTLIDDLISSKLPRKIKDRSLIWHLRLVTGLLFTVLRIKPDVVVVSVKPNVFPLYFLKLVFRYKLIVLLEGNSKRNFFSFMSTGLAQVSLFLSQMVIKRADLVIAAYSSARDWALSLGVAKENVRIVPIGVDIDIFREIQRSSDTARTGNSIIVGYIGSFRDVHCLDLLLDLMHLNDRLNAILIGSGSEEGHVIDRVNRENLALRVKFMGAVEQTEIVGNLSGVDIMWCVTPHDHWGVPIKAYESLAMGLPVIVSDRPEFRFIRDCNFGLVLDSESHDILNDRLINFLERRVDFNGRDASKYIEENNSWNKFPKVIFDKLLSK